MEWAAPNLPNSQTCFSRCSKSSGWFRIKRVSATVHPELMVSRVRQLEERSMPKKPKSGISREDTDATKTMQLLSRISQRKQEEEISRSLEFGLEAADSVVDRTISLFSRGHQPAFAGINT